METAAKMTTRRERRERQRAKALAEFNREDSHISLIMRIVPAGGRDALFKLAAEGDLEARHCVQALMGFSDHAAKMRNEGAVPACIYCDRPLAQIDGGWITLSAEDNSGMVGALCEGCIKRDQDELSAKFQERIEAAGMKLTRKH
jgi:hypothetical protein